jgi:hypothetical protein
MGGTTFTGVTQTPEAFPIVNVPGFGAMQCMDVHLSGTLTGSPTTGFTTLNPRASTIAAVQNDVMLQTPYIAVLGTGTGMAGLSAIRVSGFEVSSANAVLVSLTNGPTAIISTTLTQQRYQYVVANAGTAKFQMALAYFGLANQTVDCHVRIGLWFLNQNNSVTRSSTARNADALTYTAPSFTGSSFAAMVEFSPGELQSAYTILQVQDAGGTNSVSVEYTSLDVVSLRVQRSGVYDADVPLGPTGATFTVTVGGGTDITAVGITTGGTGYPASGTLFIQAGCGSGAVVTYASTAGVITSTNIVAGGNGYNSGAGLAPTVKVPVNIRRLIAGVPARAAITADGSHIRACINNLPAVSVSAATPFSGAATLVMGPSGQQMRRRAVAFSSITAATLQSWTAQIATNLHLGFGAGQSNALQSHGFMDNALNSTSFFLPGAYAAPAPGIPRELMPLVPADALSSSGTKRPDIRDGGDQTSGSANAGDMVGNPVGLTPSIARQFITSTSGFGASETILRLRAERYGAGDYVAYYCGNIGGAGAASLIQIPSNVFANLVWPFNNLKSNAVNCYSQALMQGWNVVLDLVYYNGNTSGVADVPTQVALMEQFRSDLTSFLSGLFPGVAPPNFVTDLYSFENAQRDCVLSNVALPSPWLISGPTFFNAYLGGRQNYYSDWLHFDGVGSSQAGELAENADWQKRTTGSHDYCRVVSVPVGAFVTDTVNVHAPTIPSADNGIQVVLDSDGSILSVHSYQFANVSPGVGNLVIILDADPGLGVATRLQVAVYGYTTPGPPYDPTQQARTIYRDSSTATFSFSGFPKYNWLGPCDILM